VAARKPAQEQLDRHERQIAAIRKVVEEGMRLVVATRKDLRDLAAAQRRTEANLQRLIESLGRQANGRKSR
jgi:hypothetical protein